MAFRDQFQMFRGHFWLFQTLTDGILNQRSMGSFWVTFFCILCDSVSIGWMKNDICPPNLKVQGPILGALGPFLAVLDPEKWHFESEKYWTLLGDFHGFEQAAAAARWPGPGLSSLQAGGAGSNQCDPVIMELTPLAPRAAWSCSFYPVYPL